jgi:hypothetical protein
MKETAGTVAADTKKLDGGMGGKGEVIENPLIAPLEVGSIGLLKREPSV